MDEKTALLEMLRRSGEKNRLLQALLADRDCRIAELSLSIDDERARVMEFAAAEQERGRIQDAVLSVYTNVFLGHAVTLEVLKWAKQRLETELKLFDPKAITAATQPLRLQVRARAPKKGRRGKPAVDAEQPLAPLIADGEL
jgi:hypothetical protein